MLMKRILYLLLSVFPLVSLAQDGGDGAARPPLLKDGRVWKYAAGNPFRHYYFKQYVHGDTLIEGNVWKKVYNGAYLQGTYEKAMREEGGKVYVHDERGTSLFLDYDAAIGAQLCQQFNRNDGSLYAYAEVAGQDTLHNNGYVYDTVELTDYYNIYIDGDTQQWEEVGSSRWIVGIGGEVGIYEPVWWENVPGITVCLISVRDGDTRIYSAPEPLWDLGVTPIRSDPSSGPCFDLQGRRLSAAPSRGIYIQDGKKHVR